MNLGTGLNSNAKDIILSDYFPSSPLEKYLKTDSRSKTLVINLILPVAWN